MAFEQAAIKVEKAQEFDALQEAIAHAFHSAKVEQFLKRLHRKGIRVRDFEGVLAKRVLEEVVGAESRFSALHLYQALTLSDQAQMREFYLSKLETVDTALRQKFKKLYQYY